MPELAGLVAQRLNKHWMAMAEGVDGHAAEEVEISAPLHVEQVATLTVRNLEFRPRKGLHQMGGHIAALTYQVA